MTPKRPDDEIDKIVEYYRINRSKKLLFEQLKSLFKKLAHEAVPEREKVICDNLEHYKTCSKCVYNAPSDPDACAIPRITDSENKIIDETHKRIEKVFE